jgi:NAD-reducing hydrogenase large subunit
LGKTVTIDPVTRIEGHAKITITLDDDGAVADARFHVTELRGFEAFCVGRPFWEMPSITARVCGICPVSHSIASAHAGDMILGVRPPPLARKLRRLINWAQLVQSHALSFFHLSAPDLLLGMESDPRERNIAGLVRHYPDVARQGVRLRAIGQAIIRTLAGQSVHPAYVVPGGVLAPLSEAGRREIAAMIPEGVAIVERALDLLRGVTETLGEEVAAYGDFPGRFLGMTAEDGALDHTDGALRMIDADGRKLFDGLPAHRFAEAIGEEAESWSYMKFAVSRDPASPGPGMPYRVGPLARLNVCDFAGTERADRALRQFRQLGRDGRPVSAGFHAHHARLIEILYALERIEATLGDDAITGRRIRSRAGVNRRVGIGASEAPRGTLFHEYHVDDDGLLTKVNLVIATGQNNRAINETILQIARKYVTGGRLTEGALNRVEHGVRLFDPCLSCATHAFGPPAFRIRLVACDGTVLDEAARG